MEPTKIKCIIWDLDNTLWSGVLSEDNNVILGRAKELLRISAEVGVIHSICSKNDESVVTKKLEELCIASFFVFNSINYDAKGLRIKNQIETMNLRAENVLFIDDEISNLKEAGFYNPNIMLSQPYIIEELIRYYQSLFDEGKQCNRIEQYRRLEVKKKLSMYYKSNEEFLLDSNINVEIKTNCMDAFERIHELCNRTNQLNFTKKRSDRDELRLEIMNADKAGYVNVQDRYGDYGIVGFYLIKNHELKHFFFSCRIMNMGVEQYVYELLEKPKLSVVGLVATNLDHLNVNWINQRVNRISKVSDSKSSMKVLLKGSCDLRRMKLFLPDNIIYEVPYVSLGKNIVYQTGIPTMAMTLKFSKDVIRKKTSELPFYSMEYYDTNLFDGDFDVVFLSTISLANLGVYIDNEDFFLSMGLPEEPMYLREFEDKYSAGGKYANGFSNTGDMFELLRSNYTYIYDRYLDDYLEEHLNDILNHISARVKVLILGNEELYHVNKTRAGAYFSKANRIIERVCETCNCKVINISELITGEDDVINHFNHFSSVVYYKLATKICEIIEEIENE